MLKGILRKTMLFLMVASVMTGCSSKVEDYDNKNINIEAKELTHDNAINFYMDINESVKDYLSDSNFKTIVYAAYSTAVELGTTNSVPVGTYSVRSNVAELKSDFFINDISSAKSYSGKSNSIVKNVLDNAKDDDFSVIATDLTTQLGDYASLASSITNALSKSQAVAIIGVDTVVRPFFVIVVGSNKRVSEFISNFKQNPNVVAYTQKNSGQIEGGLELDIVQNINYQIFAENNGIMGIYYDKIKSVENGIYYMYEYKKEVMPDGTVKEIPSYTKLDETKGSFSKVNKDYHAEDVYKYIEGTVNFSDISGSSSAVNRYVQVMPPKKEDMPEDDNNNENNTENNSENVEDIGINDITYIAMKSLVYDDKKGLAGKFKLDVPFNVIDEVKLSSLDCDISTKMYIPKDGKMVEYSGNADDFIRVSAAEGGENQGKWRVDDTNNSMLFNFTMDNVAKFPKSEGDFFKIDVNVKQFVSKDNMPKWVSEWSRTGKIANLNTLFNSLYGFQSNRNAAENVFSVYVGKAGETRSNE